MYNQTRDFGRKGSVISAISAIDIALWEPFEGIMSDNMQLFLNDAYSMDYSESYKPAFAAIIDDYIPVRLEYYKKRKAYKIAQLEKIVKILHNKARFIEEQCNDTIDLRKKNKASVKEMLIQQQYDTVEQKYDYLTSMPISSVIEENILKLREDRDKNRAILEKIRKMTVVYLWRNELNILLKKLSKLTH